MSETKRILLFWIFPISLFIIIVVFWLVLYKYAITVNPHYSTEIEALKTLNWTNMWGNVYLSTPTYSFYRISPTALFPLSMIDRDFYAPLLGISFPSNHFQFSRRLVPELILGVAAMAVVIFFLARSLEFNLLESFIAGLYAGVFKGIGWFFNFASVVHVIPLFVIYSSITILFIVKYFLNNNKKNLIGFYIFLLLAIGSWEQWVNLLAFLLLFSVWFMFIKKHFELRVFITGILVPIILFTGYMIVKYPAIKLETTNKGQEAEYVFNYPSANLMIEDVVASASLHIADVIEPAILPWPMLSQAILSGTNPTESNTWNYKIKRFQRFATAHYLAFADWYAGLFFGLFIVFSIWLFIYINKYPENFYKAGTGLLLIWTGFIAHLPIMYRVHFIVPGFEGMLGYKHMLSVVGVGLLVAWIYEKISIWVKEKTQRINPQKKFLILTITYAPFVLFCFWIITNNFAKVAWSYYMRIRGIGW